MTNLVCPHGSNSLKPLYIKDSKENEEILRESQNLPKILLNSAAAANVVMLGAGYFTPLSGFMGKNDALNVAKNMLTEKGLFWPVPILRSFGRGPKLV